MPVGRRRPAQVVGQARRQAARSESPPHIGIAAGGQADGPQLTDRNALFGFEFQVKNVRPLIGDGPDAPGSGGKLVLARHFHLHGDGKRGWAVRPLQVRVCTRVPDSGTEWIEKAPGFEYTG